MNTVAFTLWLRHPTIEELAPELFEVATGQKPSPNVFRLPRDRGDRARDMTRRPRPLLPMVPAFHVGIPAHPAEVEGVQAWLDEAFQEYGRIIVRAVAGNVLRIDRGKNESDRSFHARCEELVAVTIRGD